MLCCCLAPNFEWAYKQCCLYLTKQADFQEINPRLYARVWLWQLSSFPAPFTFGFLFLLIHVLCYICWEQKSISWFEWSRFCSHTHTHHAVREGGSGASSKTQEAGGQWGLLTSESELWRIRGTRFVRLGFNRSWICCTIRSMATESVKVPDKAGSETTLVK